MKALTSLLGLALASSLAAQSPLTTIFAWTNGYTAIATGRNVYFDLTVNSTITIRGFEVNTQSAVGTPGTLEFWIANAPITTYLGNQQTLANWTLQSSGPLTASAQDTPTPVCLATPITLVPGNYAVALKYVGISAVWTTGNGTAIPGSGNQTFSNADITMRCGLSQVTPFGVASVETNSIRFNGSILYYPGADPGLGCSALPAKNDGLGTEGCYRNRNSVHDLLPVGATAATAATVASATLSGKAIKFIPSAGGYVVIPSLTPFHTPVTPTNLLGFLPDNDDGELSQVLAAPGFPGPTGFVTAMNVHNNGIISEGPIEASITPSFFPFVPDLLAAPVTAWYSWHDWNIVEGGQILFDEDATTSYFTWSAVESYPTGGTPNPGTMQFQFNRATGEVDIVWGAIATVGVGNNASDLHLIGYSLAGPSLNHGDINLATFTSVVVEAIDVFPLTVTASGRVVLGSTVVYTTSNESVPIPPTLPLGILLIALDDLTTFGFPPPLGADLGSLLFAIPSGCPLNVNILAAPIQQLLISPVAMTYSQFVPLDLSFVGVPWYVQSVFLDPQFNGFGQTSNMIKQTVGTW